VSTALERIRAAAAATEDTYVEVVAADVAEACGTVPALAPLATWAKRVVDGRPDGGSRVMRLHRQNHLAPLLAPATAPAS
jgi:hypothetical protein